MLLPKKTTTATNDNFKDGAVWGNNIGSSAVVSIVAGAVAVAAVAAIIGVAVAVLQQNA